MLKPNWDEYRNHVVAVIASYREYNDTWRNPNTKSYDAFQAKQEYERLFNQLCGLRTAITMLFPDNPFIHQLNGFILFAAESENNHKEFMRNIDAAIADLKKT